jgi:hypothetical protein
MNRIPEPENYDNTVLRWLAGCIVFAIVMIAILAFTSEAGAAPRRVPVTIASVRASEGFYSVQLGNGRALVLVPLDRTAPALTEGGAILEGRVLWQGGWGYRVRG